MKPRLKAQPIHRKCQISGQFSAKMPMLQKIIYTF